MKSKKSLRVFLSVLIVGIFVITLYGQQGKPFKEIWDEFAKIWNEIDELKTQSGDFFPDYSGVIAGTWEGFTYVAAVLDPDDHNLIVEYGPLSITFDTPNNEGQGNYVATPKMPFFPHDPGIISLSGNYHIKGDLLVLLADDFNYFDWGILEIQGNKMRFSSSNWSIYKGQVRRFYERQ